MLSPKPISALEQIRATIKMHEAEARHARGDAEASLALAEQAEASAIAHEQAAEQWRSILSREEREATEGRTVTVKFETNDSAFIAGIERAAEAFREATATRRLAHGGVHKFAEPAPPWEAFISGRPNRRRILCSGNPGCVCGRHGDGSTKGNEHG